MLNDIGISVINLHDIPPLPEVVEDGKTFKENAEKRHTRLQKLLVTGV